MRILFKALFLLLLSIVIFGTGGYFIYDMFVKPQRLEKEDIAFGTPTPPPDASLPEFARCEALRREGKLVESRAAFESFIDNNPESTKLEEAKAELGTINVDIFSSKYPAPEKQEYVVQKGDNLMKVAAKMKTTPELIMRSNNLSGTVLRLGERLLISQSAFSITISRKQKNVILFNKNRFFKQYSVKAWNAPAARLAAPVVGKVRGKLAWKNSQQVAVEWKGLLRQPALGGGWR